jgi:mersacidin/lichenicidin family type 2 lantibiotic
MSNIDIIRAWKDAEYRNSLTQEQREALPENPAGIVDLSSAELSKVTGGLGSGVSSLPCELDKLGYTKNTFPCCRTMDITCESRTVSGKLAL